MNNLCSSVAYTVYDLQYSVIWNSLRSLECHPRMSCTHICCGWPRLQHLLFHCGLSAALQQWNMLHSFCQATATQAGCSMLIKPVHGSLHRTEKP